MMFEHPSRSKMNLIPHLFFPSVMGHRHLLSHGMATILGGQAVIERGHCTISACLIHSRGARGRSCGEEKNREPPGLGLETIGGEKYTAGCLEGTWS